MPWISARIWDSCSASFCSTRDIWERKQWGQGLVTHLLLRLMCLLPPAPGWAALYRHSQALLHVLGMLPTITAQIKTPCRQVSWQLCLSFHCYSTSVHSLQFYCKTVIIEWTLIPPSELHSGGKDPASSSRPPLGQRWMLGVRDEAVAGEDSTPTEELPGTSRWGGHTWQEEATQPVTVSEPQEGRDGAGDRGSFTKHRASQVSLLRIMAAVSSLLEKGVRNTNP